MKKLFLSMLLFGSYQLSAQSSVPQLLHVGVDTPTHNFTAMSPEGNFLTWRYYQYCTNVTCFNDGLQVDIYDSSGSKTMTMKFEKPQSDYATSSKIFLLDGAFDNEGNFYMAGRVHSNVIMSPNDATPTIITGNTAMSNSFDMFVAKYRVSDGKMIWAKHMPSVGSGMSSVGFMHLAVDNANNVYVQASKINGTLDVNPGPGTATITDNFIAKYTKDGAYVTHKSVENISTQLRKALHWTNNGLYLVTSMDSAGKQTMLIRQYDPATLNTIKSRKLGWFDENNMDNGYRKKIDVVFNQGNMWLMGTHSGSLNFPAASGAITQSLGTYDRGFFLAKLNNNWDVTDARILGVSKSNPMAPVKIGFDGQNNLLVIGGFKDSMDMDLGAGKMMLYPLTSASYKTVGFMAYYNQSLDLQWAKTFGDTASFYLYGAGFGNNKRLYFIGAQVGTANFSLTSTPAYTSGIGSVSTVYVARYMWASAGSVTDVDDVDAGRTARLYPNPCTDQLFVQLDDVKGQVQLSVYDLSGKLVMSQMEATIKQTSVNTSTLAPGMYYLKVQHGTQIEAHSFLKR